MHACEHDPRPPFVEHIKTVTNSAQCCNSDAAELELWPQPCHMHIDCLGFPYKTGAPRAREDLVPRQSHPFVFKEDPEQVELTRRLPLPGWFSNARRSLAPDRSPLPGRERRQYLETFNSSTRPVTR